jgi:N4-gp56 family major capsid protein
MTTADGGGYLGGDTVKEVFNRAALEAYRAENVYRRVADVKWDEGSDPMPGNPVTFTIITAIAPQTTPLSETVEPTPGNIADTTKSITLAEYGHAVKPTKKVKVTSFLGMDLIATQEITANMEESVDIVARDVLVAGSNALFAGDATSRLTLDLGTTDDILTGNNIRRARAYLAGLNTPPPPGSTMYVSFIHPDVNYDLQSETGQQAWSAPHVYADPSAIYTGEIGALSGVRFVENANAKIWANAGSGSPGGLLDVYATIFVGRQALGEAVGVPQHVIIAGPFDDLQRFVSIGWYGLLGYGRIRENSLLRYESLSSIGANT